MEQTTKGPISRSMNIQELANAHPEAVMVMAERGLHCFGCHGAAFDTVEAGAKGHGMSDEDIEKMVDDMNQVVASKVAAKTVPKEEPAHDMKLSDKASSKLVELMKAENKAGFGLRVKVVPGGCAGFSYDLDFDEKAKDGDIVLDKSGIKIFIDKDSLEQMNGATIDYVDGLQGSGFKIENPNAQGSCGCGKSFS